MSLDKFLNSTDGLMQSNNPSSGFQFDAGNERGVVGNVSIRNASIDYAKIASFNFNQGTGGTLTLGGTNDGNGVLSVKNNSGTEVVRLDSSGVTVTNGSITIQNSAGSNVIDSLGLNSTTSFVNQQTTKTSNQNTTSTSYEAVTGFSITTGSFQRATNLLIGVTMTGYHNDEDGVLIGILSFNGTAIGPAFVIGRGGGVVFTNVSSTSSVNFIYQAPAGVGTISALIRQNNIGGTGVLEASFLNSVLNYVALGQ